MTSRTNLKRPYKQVLFVSVVLVLGIALAYKYAGRQLIADFEATKAAVVSDESNNLKTAWRGILDKQNAPVDIAVYDHKTGVTTQLSNDANAQFKTASIVKVAILANLLRQHATNGTGLSNYEDELATAMIQDSDNDAATALLETEGGNTQPDALFKRLGMTHSHMDSESWGYSTTTATDQLTLLKNIFYQSRVLTDSSRTYMQGLMNNIAVDQSWGITAGLTPDATVALKNGWLADKNGWIINSTGHITSKQSDYVIAILSNQNVSEDAGIDLVQQLAKATYTTLNAQ